MITMTCDMDMVSSILWRDEIWEVIAPKGTERFSIPYQDECFYFLVNEGDGVIIFHPFEDGVKIHPNILPEKRGKKAYKAIEESVREVFEMGYRNVYAEIPKELKHVIWCAKALGFKTLQSGDKHLLVRRRLDS